MISLSTIFPIFPSPTILFSLYFLLRSAKLQIVHTFFYFFAIFFGDKTQKGMHASYRIKNSEKSEKKKKDWRQYLYPFSFFTYRYFPERARRDPGMTSRIDQGFSTNQKFQPKNSTNQKTAGTKCLSAEVPTDLHLKLGFPGT